MMENSFKFNYLKLRNIRLETELERVKKENEINLKMYELQSQYYNELFNLIQDYIIGAVSDYDINEKVSKLDMKLESLMLEIIKEGEL